MHDDSPNPYAAPQTQEHDDPLQSLRYDWRAAFALLAWMVWLAMAVAAIVASVS